MHVLLGTLIAPIVSGVLTYFFCKDSRVRSKLWFFAVSMVAIVVGVLAEAFATIGSDPVNGSPVWAAKEGLWAIFILNLLPATLLSCFVSTLFAERAYKRSKAASDYAEQVARANAR